MLNAFEAQQAAARLKEIPKLLADAIKLRKSGKLEHAESLVRSSLSVHPHSLQLQDQLGQIYLSTLKYDEAIQVYRDILTVNPNFSQAYFNLALALQSAGNLKAAIKWYKLSLNHDPLQWRSYYNLGSIYHREEEWSAAEQCFYRVLELKPRSPEAYDFLGRIYRDSERLTEAVNILHKGIEMGPNEASLYNTLGQVYFKLGRYDDSLNCYNEAIHLKPDFSEAKFSRSLAELKKGNFRDGLKDYEYRAVLNKTKKRPYQTKKWNGEDLSGKTLLVHWEQGLGDTIQFARYLKLLNDLGINVIFECQPALLPLMRGVCGYHRLIQAGAELPHHDAHISLLSLPLIFNTNVKTIPADIPYISLPAELKMKWRKNLKESMKFRIGINWRGNLEAASGRTRSISLTEFLSLKDLPNTEWFSLQLSGDCKPQERVPWLQYFRGDFDKSSGAFMDTAVVMQQLDLIITCDTSIAHLAGGLGCKVWSLLPYSADWRWFLDREDSPWYPTMRLFRQSRPGNWESVFQQVKAELLKLDEIKISCP